VYSSSCFPVLKGEFTRGRKKKILSTGSLSVRMEVERGTGTWKNISWGVVGGVKKKKRNFLIIEKSSEEDGGRGGVNWAHNSLLEKCAGGNLVSRLEKTRGEKALYLSQVKSSCDSDNFQKNRGKAVQEKSIKNVTCPEEFWSSYVGTEGRRRQYRKTS